MLDRHILSQIDPEKILGFLASIGWKNTNSDRKESYRYVHSDGGVLFVPADKGAVRYSRAVANVIETLSEWEGTTPTRIFQRIVLPSSDALILSFKGPSADRGSLPIGRVHDVIRSMKDSIKFAACGELQPMPFYVGVKKQAREIAETARFGQTEIGSFVLSIILPHSSTSGGNDPIERGVVKRLYTGIRQAKDCVINGNSLDFQKAFQDGLNANLAESLSQMKVEDLALNFSVNWDERAKVEDHFRQPIAVGERTFDMLESIGSKFRSEATAKEADIERAAIIGLAWDASDLDEDDAETPYVDLKVIEPSSFPIKKFRVTLSESDYKKAGSAHLASKHISLSGKLVKYKGRWWMRRYSGLVNSQ